MAIQVSTALSRKSEIAAAIADLVREDEQWRALVERLSAPEAKSAIVAAGTRLSKYANQLWLTWAPHLKCLVPLARNIATVHSRAPVPDYESVLIEVGGYEPDEACVLSLWVTSTAEQNARELDRERRKLGSALRRLVKAAGRSTLVVSRRAEDLLPLLSDGTRGLVEEALAKSRLRISFEEFLDMAAKAAERGADPWHRGQARVTPREIGLGGDRLGEALLEEADIGLDPRQAALGEAPEHGILKLCGLVFDCDVLVTELAPHGDDLGDSGGGRVMAHDVRGHGRDILGDQPGIEPIVLGEGAASAGELPKPIRIDAAHREAGGEQGAEDAALVAAARLEPNGGEEQAAQPPDQRAPACLVVGDREACALREQQHVEPVLRHVDSTEALLYHPLVPSLLMRARALATVREWKKRLEHQAHSRPCHRGGYGLPVATGAVS